MTILSTRFYISVLLLFLPFCSYTQDIRWNTAPQKGFVFQINNKEAEKLLTRSSRDTIFNGLLHTLVDSFDVKQGWIKRPDKGHFILTNVIENTLNCEYTSVFPYQVYLLKEYDALALQVLDLEGNVREDAVVKFKLKRIRIDEESKTYRLENKWFNGHHKVVTVELDGFRSVFNVEKHDVPNWYHSNYEGQGPSFYSYLITDKNKYKPREKVRFKSFALSQSRTPLRRDLSIWLIDRSRSTKVGMISPHRPGSYAGEFQLHDSLKLTLDQSYSLELRDKNGRIVSSCHFKYEDYELNGNKLDIRILTSKQFHPSANEVSVTATDVNGLILKDAKATVIVKTKTIRETFQPIVILGDTLLYKEVNLNPNSATLISIPSSIFEKTNTTYEVTVSVLNSQNQRMQQTLTATHYYAQYELTTRFSNDSIIYELLNNGVSVRNAPITLFYNSDAEGIKVNLPYKEKLNASVTSVRLVSDLASRQITMRNLLPILYVKGGIEKDSFNISLHNPQQLEVSWYVYQGSQLIQKGFGKELDFSSGIVDRTQTYYVELLYSFGGEDLIKRRDFEFKPDYLNVSLDVPERVYPGQEIEATIQVNNQEGEPVSGVDLTAMAVNAKLNDELEDLPYYGAGSSPRSAAAHYTKSDMNKRSATLPLDYARWEKLLRLDTMMYYQFTYPGSTPFYYASTIKDSTQFAAYVMKDGSAQQVYVIEVDRKPVYFSWAEQPRGYSFYISPCEPHQIALRLFDRVLVMDSVLFENGKKTILSIDLDHVPEDVKTFRFNPVALKNDYRRRHPVMRYAFTETEIPRLTKYLASFKNKEGNSFLEKKKEFIPLFNGWSAVHGESMIVGPIEGGKLTYSHDRTLKTTYNHTGGFTYAFEDNIVYKMEPPKLIPDYLTDVRIKAMATVNDLAITKTGFLTHKVAQSKWRTRVIDVVDYASRVRILLPDEKADSGIAAFLWEECSSKKIVSPCQSYYSSMSEFNTIPHGCYSAIVVYNNGRYLKTDPIALKSYTHVVADLNSSAFHPADSLSKKWLLTSTNDCYASTTFSKTQSVTPTKNLMLHYSEWTLGNIRGTIYDDENSPLPGANVIIKGTATGTATDAVGKFTLDISEATATLVISFVGYMTKEIEVQLGSEINVYMTPDITSLSEVVVVGYGATTKASLSYSVSSVLYGRAAGVSISTPDKPLPEYDNPEDVQDSTREAEQHLYQELLNLNTIRSNFSDVGFWEPRLYTDKRGQSKFTTKFPDDITRWNATVFAMNRYLQTGMARKSIKSYKPLMAELHVPQFLTKGDSSEFLGKVLNYTGDKKIIGTVNWKGGKSDFNKDVDFADFHTDKLPVAAVSLDSLTVQYMFTRDDGYRDGEERTVPVVEQGIIRADGTLAILKNKESVKVRASSNEVVIVEVLASQLDLYAGDARYLLNYQYDCNEQLASKLLGLLNYKLLMTYEGNEFKYDKDINKIIARLLKNQNEEFLWSWWDVSPMTSYWMSSHILRSLKAARDAGYKVDLDVQNIARNAEYKFEFLHNYNIQDIDLINALATWGAELKYRKHVHILDSMLQGKQAERMPRSRRYRYLYSMLKEKMLLMETRQLTKLPYERDSLLKYRKDGILGDVYFSDNKPVNYWYDDELASNAIAYRIIKNDSLLNDLKVPMQLHFVDQRKKGSWNTYHVSNVLMTMLPDLLAEGVSKKHQTTLELRGKVNATIDQFPYHLELQPGEELTMNKTSGLPTYFMKYVKERVTKAKSGVEGFAIKTSLANDRQTIEAGKVVELTVEVDVTKEVSEYVMIEIPIPGACSYADKSQGTNSWETHREYFKERTVIFCEQMKPGKYIFVVHLLPRFTGRYLINPAQVSLMYVPVVNANTDMKAIKVK